MSEVSVALKALKIAFGSFDEPLNAIYNYPTDTVNVNAGKLLVLRHAKEIQSQFQHEAQGVINHTWWCEGLLALHKFTSNQAPPPYPTPDETAAELLVEDYLNAIRNTLSANITLGGIAVMLGDGQVLTDYMVDRFFWSTTEFFGIRFLFKVEQESVVPIGG